jgi:5-formyltetrahydrofolate cyclo-ligase
MTDPREHALRVHAKQAIRERMRGLRRVLPEVARRARSEALCARVLALPELASARTVVGYHALKTEADPQAALHSVRARGARIGLPRVMKGGGLRLCEWDGEAESLEQNALGIFEPRADSPEIAGGDVEVIFVPALALDMNGHRVGYGQGYYDRLLAGMPRAFSVGIGFDFQLLFELPSTEHDRALSAIVTDASSSYVSR